MGARTGYRLELCLRTTNVVSCGMHCFICVLLKHKDTSRKVVLIYAKVTAAKRANRSFHIFKGAPEKKERKVTGHMSHVPRIFSSPPLSFSHMI